MTVLLNTLYITNPDAYLKLEGDTVCVIVGDQKKLQVPLHHLGGFVLFGHVSVSPALLGRCAQDGRSVVWLSMGGKFLARVEGPVSGNVLLRLAQYRASDNEETSVTLAKAMIIGKLRNSRHLLMRGARENKNGDEQSLLKKGGNEIGEIIRQIETIQNIEQLRGCEGNAARIYFELIHLLIKNQFREVFRFENRNRRPPKDKFNALISFLYSLTLADVKSALETVGLDPQCGYLHTHRPGRPSLALDLLEEFRSPICDRLACSLINRGQLQSSDFIEEEGGAVFLNDSGRKTVLEAYQLKKQETLVHPVLESEVAIGLLPQLQAKLLARFLRHDIEQYVPFLTR